MPGFVLLVRDRKDGDPAMRIGYTVTKKIGGAVIRNRMKRRFRALARALLPHHGVAGADHVLIGRSGGVERDFSLLAHELEKALKRIQAPPKERAPGAAPRPPRGSGPSPAPGQPGRKARNGTEKTALPPHETAKAGR